MFECVVFAALFAVRRSPYESQSSHSTRAGMRTIARANQASTPCDSAAAAGASAPRQFRVCVERARALHPRTPSPEHAMFARAIIHSQRNRT
jgi:hypothetical protein